MKIEISYKNSLIGSLSAGESLALHLNGSKLTEDLIVKAVGEAVELPSLSAPTIEIADSTLNIYDEEGLATSYDILVDGEVVATVEVPKEVMVNITLYGGSTSGGLEQAFVKFGSAPTSSSDYDYFVEPMSSGTDASDGNGVVETRNISVSNKAYIWGYKYELSDSGILTAGTTYSDATEVALAEGDVLTLYGGNDD